MGCCAPNGVDAFFSEKVARRDAEGYRRHGLRGTARLTAHAVRDRGVSGRTVLEVGGGVGAIQVELLKAGAAGSTVIEASPAYGPFADALLREAGLEGRVARRILDFAADADEVPRADVVILHRVLCCYPDHHALARAAASHADRLLVLTYPRDAAWIRGGAALANLGQRMLRRDFRVYVHPPGEIAGIVTRQGLRERSVHRGPVWETRVFERDAVTVE